MKVEREKNKPTGKTKRKREKGNDNDTSKAIQSNIEGECGFYMLILCWKSFTSERIFSYFYWFFFYLFGSDGSITAIRERKMKESSRKKNRKNEESNTLTGKCKQPSTEAEVEFHDQNGAFIEF